MDVEDLPIIITDYPAQDGARKFINESKMSLSMLLSNPSGRSKPSFEPTVGPLLGSGLFASLNDSVLTGTGSRKRSQIDSGLLSMLPRTTLGLSNCIPQLSDSSGSLSKKRKFPTDEFSDLTRKASVLERECREVYSENERLEQQVDQLEKDKKNLKLREQELNESLQKEKNKLKEVEQRLKEAEENLKVKDERISQLEQSNEHFENLRKTMQSSLDKSYRFNGEQEPLKWFAELSGTALHVPKVTMRFLAGYVADFATFWEELGMALGMENTVKAEQTQPITAKQKCLHVLQQWTTLASASYPSLLDALSKLNQRPLAVKIEENILKEISDSDSKEENQTQSLQVVSSVEFRF